MLGCKSICCLCASACRRRTERGISSTTILALALAELKADGRVKAETNYYPFRMKDSLPVVKREVAAVSGLGATPTIRAANGGSTPTGRSATVSHDREITPFTGASAHAMPMSVNGKSFALHNSGASIAGRFGAGDAPSRGAADDDPVMSAANLVEISIGARPQVVVGFRR